MPNDDIHDMRLISEGINHRQRDRRRHKSGEKLQEGFYPGHSSAGCKYVEVNVVKAAGEAQPEKPRCRSRTLERGERSEAPGGERDYCPC